MSLKKHLLSCLFGIAALGLSANELPTPAGADQYWQPPQKKFIDASWATPKVDFLLKNIEEMERTAPLQGIRINYWVKGKLPNGKMYDAHDAVVFTSVYWQYEWFADTIKKLKSVKFKKFTDNFLSAIASTARFKWDDDKAWGAVANNMGVLARVAKETGMKGIMFDPEEYYGQIWAYVPERDGDYAAAAKIARQRGQAVGKAMFKEFPEIRFFCLYSVSMDLFDRSSYPLLLQAFMNGIYDVMPYTAKIIEGHEGPGYTAANRDHFRVSRYDVDHGLLKRIYPENIAKYKACTQYSPGFYPDAYFSRWKGDYWHDSIARETSQKKTTAKALFWKNLSESLDFADEYVWLYSEKGAWWDKVKKKGVQYMWEKHVPGITKGVEAALNPEKYLDFLAGEGGKKNLLKNGDFAKKGSIGYIPGWTFWQRDTSKCQYAWDAKGGPDGKGAVVFVNKSQKAPGVIREARPKGYAFLYQNVNVTAGSRYLLTVKTSSTMPYPGYMRLSVTWKNAKKDVHPHLTQKCFAIPGKAGEFKTLSMVISVPDGVDQMIFGLQGSNIASGEKVIFADAAVYKLYD
ncbi:MAG: hypothetical protein J6W00_07785 [Lentisphaeria bacterium]|nr:hypothetical protein [Lentisphaeria bacterium]